jgi:hypothetical protein
VAEAAGLGMVLERIDRGVELVEQVDEGRRRMEGEVARPAPARVRQAGSGRSSSAPPAASKAKAETTSPPRQAAKAKRLAGSVWIECAFGAVPTVWRAAPATPSAPIGLTATRLSP